MLTFTGPQVSPPTVSLSAPNPWAGCHRHGHSPHGVEGGPGWETVTCPRANGQQRADLGSEPRQTPEPKAVLALNAAEVGGCTDTPPSVLCGSPLAGVQPALDLTAGPLAPRVRLASPTSRCSARHHALHKGFSDRLSTSPQNWGGRAVRGDPQPARRKTKTERFT